MDERFSRHILLPEWDQSRLGGATVIIMGIGALGNEVAQCLALAGVGRLILCDPDVIEKSNLSRTPLFRECDIGRLKVEAAAEVLTDLAPGLRVEPRAQRLETGAGLAELRDATLTLGCLDSRAARLELAGRCGLVRAPWIDGGTGPWTGELRLYLDPDGPCYGCGQDAEALAINDDPLSCGVPVTGSPTGAAAPISAAIGSQMALFAVRFLMGLEVPRDVLVFDGGQGRLEHVRQSRDPDCPYHRTIETVRPIRLSAQNTAGELLEALGSNKTPLSWNPIRLQSECSQCGFKVKKPGPLPATEDRCPNCSTVLRSRTTLEVTDTLADIRLIDLGIPEREIVAVRTTEGFEFVELQGGDEE